jgi:pilus assembly protein CpaF
MLRVHVVIPPLSPDGTQITLRRLDHARPFELSSFSKNRQLVDDLAKAVFEKKSILIAGATGAGKTSLLTSLMTLIPAIDRVLILEDSPELPMIPRLCTRLLARGNRFGYTQGATWDLNHLVFEALRMRPTRLILGECRGSEAIGIARALQTGHGGIMSTVHAGSAREALARFAELAQVSSSDLGWDLVVHLAINSNQEREITETLWTKAF